MRRVSMQMFAQHYGLELKADPTRLSSDGTIRLRLTFAEVQGDAGERLGIKFNDGQAVQLLPKLQGPDAVSATLLFLANKGQARVLATPSLVARSGTESEFLAGGEFAVRSGNYRKSEVTWKRHGLWLKFKPVLDPRGIVRIDVQTEFSMPDFAGAVDGIPSVRSSRTNSSMDLSLGQTLLLSGLIRSWEGSSWTGLAGFAEIPVIGRLFRSEDFAKNRTELMVFVTPELAASEPESKERDEWD
jgi:Flp pilus assembly secretin CpaC